MAYEELHHFLKPIKPAWIRYSGMEGPDVLGHRVNFFDGSAQWFTQLEGDVAVIGVPEVRNSIDGSGSAGAPAMVRNWLYGMRRISGDLRIVDAGDVCGNTLNDRYEALAEVVSVLSAKMVVLLIGGTQDLTVPVVQGLKRVNQAVNLAVVDAAIDLDVTNADFSSGAFLNRLVLEKSCCVDDVVVMGCQYYFYSVAQELFLKERNHALLRLKDLRSPNIGKSEVVLRDARFLSFDFRALAQQGGWLPGGISPNGLSAVDACQIMYYAGTSDVMQVVGLFETDASEEVVPVNGPIAAQLIWHFLEGMGARCGDYPFRSLKDYKYIVVPMDDFNESLNFYHNPINNRWWMEVSFNEDKKVVACFEEDYQKALNKEFPPKWWRYFLKSGASSELMKKK